MARTSSNIAEMIYQDLNQEISCGHYKVGDLIPSETDLAEKYKATRFFARKALDRLEQQGLIKNHRGVGRKLKKAGSVLKRLGVLNDQSLEVYNHRDPLMPAHLFDWQHGVFKACSESGVVPVHITGGSRNLKDRIFLLNQMLESNIDAIIFKLGVINVEDANDFLLKLKGCGVPVISAFSRIAKTKGIDNFYCNYYSVTKMQCTYLINRGHRDIAYVYGELLGDGCSDNYYRHNGFIDTMRMHGLGVGDDVIVEVPHSMFDGNWYKNGYYAASQLHVRGVLGRISGIVALNDPMAEGVIARLNELGYKVPEDISITGFDNDPRYRHLNLTTGMFNFLDETCSLVKKFIDKINSNEESIVEKVLEPVFVERLSVKKL
ncbi:MAG: GntR family transcriptional regulator [Victivallales bacterium]|nr:GntR family transcriptional regulator [Victivallales bacterium]